MSLRNILGALICLFLSLTGRSQTWEWVDQAVKGNGNNYVNALCTTDSDFVYITGRVKSTGVFGTGTGGVTLSNFGDRDIYISKYDNSGGFKWVKHYGGTGSDYGYGVSSDSLGNTYLAGHFTISANFGTAGIINTFGGADIYLLKHTPAGTLSWVKHFGSSNSESAYAISTSKAGISVVGGEMGDTSHFDSLQNISNGGLDMFIGKFDQNGVPYWVKNFGAASDDAVYGVYQDKSGNIYATGKFTGTVNFGGSVLSSSTAGNSDIVILKMDSSGNVLWARKQGSGVADQGQSVTIDPDGNVIVCGYWAQTNIFIMKYSPTGTLLWSNIQGSPGFDVGNGVVTDSTGGIYVGGYYSGTMVLGATTLTCSGADDIFVEKLSPSGTVQWAKRSGGSASDHCFGLAINSLNELVVGGGFQGTGIFDAFSLNDPTGTYDAYVGKLIQPLTAAFTCSGNTICKGSSVSFTDASIGFPTSYAWSFPGGAPLSAIGKNPTVVYDSAGTYDVQLIIKHGSVADTIIMPGYIQVMDPIQVYVQTADSIICPGAYTVLNADTIHHSYQWSTGDTTLDILVNAAGTYTLTASDVNGCISVDSVSIQYHNLFPVNLPADTTLCWNQTIVLDAGAGYEQYNWSTSESTAQISVSTTTWISVTVTDTNNCTSSDSISVTVMDPVNIWLGSDTVVCAGANIVFNAGSGYINYTWSDGSTDTSLAVNGPGLYWVEVTDAFGCMNADTVMYSNYPPSFINLGADTVVCAQDTLGLDAGSGFMSYLWNEGSSGAVLLVTQPGAYWVRITDSYGCITSDTVLVSNFPISEVDLGPDTTICTSQTILVDAGTGFTTYLWSNGSTGSSILVNSSSQVWVQVTDANMCFSQDTLNVTAENCLDVSNTDNAGEITIYPNPASEYVIINTGAMAPKATCTVYKINQQLVGTYIVNDGNKVIDVSNYASGMYLFTIHSDKGWCIKKVSIE